MVEQGVIAKLRPSARGAMVVLGLFAFGGVILGGLYLAPRGHAPAAPANVPIGVPHRALRFVCYDLARQHPVNDPLIRVITKLQPDYIMLAGVEEDDAIEAAEMLGMQHWFHPQLYQRSERLGGKRGTWGNLILGQQALYGGSPMGGIRGGFGGWATSIVDGREFFVACAHFSPGDKGVAEAGELRQIWKERGSPPLVLAVLPSDPTPPAGLDFFAHSTGQDGGWIYLTKEWSVVGINPGSASGKGMAPICVDIAGAP